MLLIPIRISFPSLCKGNNSLKYLHIWFSFSKCLYLQKSLLTQNQPIYFSKRMTVWCATILRETLADVFVLLSHLQAPFKELLVFQVP